MLVYSIFPSNLSMISSLTMEIYYRTYKKNCKNTKTETDTSRIWGRYTQTKTYTLPISGRVNTTFCGGKKNSQRNYCIIILYNFISNTVPWANLNDQE